MLRDRVVAGLLPRVDAFGVAPREVEHRVRHEPVVDDHVRLLHEPQGPEREQVRVSRARRRPGTPRRPCPRSRSRRARSRLRGAHRPRVPRAPARLSVRPPPLRGTGVSAPSRRFARALQVGPRRGTGRSRPSWAGMMVSRRARRMRARMGAAPPVETAATRGERSRIEGRMNEHSDRRSTALTGMPRSPGGGCDGVCKCVVVGRDDDELHAVQVAVAERAPVPCDPRLAGQLAQPRREGGRDHDEPRSGAQQQPGLGLRRLRAADEQAGLAADGEEDRQVVHGTACLAAGVATGRQFERPQCVRSSAVQGAANRACASISPRRWAPLSRRNWRTLALRRGDRGVRPICEIPRCRRWELLGSKAGRPRSRGRHKSDVHPEIGLWIATSRTAWHARGGRGPMSRVAVR